MGYLIDTCIWVDVERGDVSPQQIAAVTGDDAVYLSPVTLAELKYGAECARSADIKQKRLAALQRLRGKPTLAIDAETGLTFGRLAAEVARQGRGHKFRIQDLWLASQAVQHQLNLLTHNLKDFKDIPGLDVVSLNVRPAPQ